MSITETIKKLRASLPAGVELIAISKTHPAEMIQEAYNAGQRAFGENRPQEMKSKYGLLPKDIEWHMIGHLQTNKIKYIAPFVKMVHSVDSDRLLAALNSEAIKCGRTIDYLFEVHLAQEESKSGWLPEDLKQYINEGTFKKYGNLRPRGLMTVATQTDDKNEVEREFRTLRDMLKELAPIVGDGFDTLSMGMTHDYQTAIACGSTMVRIGSMIFGERDYSK